MRGATLAIVATLASGCSLVSCEHAEPNRVPLATSAWPRASSDGLPLATPATEVIVRAGRVEVRNEALLATWPAEALARARAASDAPDWPQVAARIDVSAERGLGMPALRQTLERARDAERAATGAGSGAGAFNLRVASDVPFATVERVLYSAARAGYSTPRLLLASESGERMLRWPRARPHGAPSRAEIEAALRGEAPSIVEPTDSARVALTSEGATARLGRREPVCELEPAAERCARALAGAGGGDRVTLEVSGDVRFERVAAIVQALVREFDEVSVVGG